MSSAPELVEEYRNHVNKSKKILKNSIWNRIRNRKTWYIYAFDLITFYYEFVLYTYHNHMFISIIQID